MPDYLTTKEVAALLRLNEKKVYALVADGKLPAARISGKWLFPRKQIDEWVDRNTVYPASGLMGALLDQMLVIQGSDDWLLSRAMEGYQSERKVPVPNASIGSMAGLRALSLGLAHLAGCHVDNEQVERLVTTAEGCYLISLYERQQGLMFDPDRTPGILSLGDVARLNLRFGDRQSQSGTHRLACDLFSEAGVDPEGLTRVGPFASHLEVGLAVRTGRADAGMGIEVAADQCGLGFLPLHVELFKLAVPVAYASHPQVAGFMEFALAHFREAEKSRVPGYGFQALGHLEVIGAPEQPPRPKRATPIPPWVNQEDKGEEA